MVVLTCADAAPRAFLAGADCLRAVSAHLGGDGILNGRDAEPAYATWTGSAARLGVSRLDEPAHLRRGNR